MQPIVIVIAGVALAALIAVGAYVSMLRARERRDGLARLAERFGWEFDPSSDYSHDDRFPDLSAFQQGHSRRAFNTLRGALGVEAAAWPVQMGDFEYKVTQSNGKTTTTTTYSFSYAIVQTPYRLAPNLTVRREGLFDKLAAVLGFDDIDFESEEFSRRFQVKSSDKRFAYDMLHPRMMDYLLSQPPPSIELALGNCCLSTGKLWSPVEFEAIIGWMTGFFALWPRHVAQALESQETQP